MNALNQNGPEFLLWYLHMFALAGAAGFLLRWLLRRARDPAGGADLDNYEIAWLKDGPRGVVRAALAALHRRELVSVYMSWVSAVTDKTCRGCRTVTDDPTTGLPAIERAVLQAMGSGSKQTAELEGDLATECGEIDARLAARGLALTPGWKALVCWVPLFGMLFCLWMGTIKLALGIANDRPVVLLIGVLAASVALLVVAVRRRPRRTTAGDRKLKALTRRHAALRTTMDTTASLAPDDAGLAVALWGQAALATVAFFSLSSLFDPRKAFGANGWGSSSGVTGCGSGGGDGGGGGGCGGGCGGCGGCGGE